MIRKTTIAALTLVFSFLFVGVCYSQEIPAPGTVIDKNNYKKYAHLFPQEFLAGFENGFDGLMLPFVLRVGPTTPSVVPKPFLQLSAKNKGKFTIDKDGWIPGWTKTIGGLPFPDLNRGDKDFVQKFMWNYDNRYIGFDDNASISTLDSWEKRKGEALRMNQAVIPRLSYTNRLYVGPKPNFPNPLGLGTTTLIHFVSPAGMKDTMILSYAFADPKVSYETHMYIPSMRRVLRSDAGQRSVPLSGSIASMDDTDGFSGRIAEFTYTLVGEQKVLMVADTTNLPNTIRANHQKGLYKGYLPWNYDQKFQVRDNYVIDIKAKDPKYPQGRKRIWVDKTTLITSYAVAYDRAGKPWKLWLIDTRMDTMPDGERATLEAGSSGVDIQFGIANFNVMSLFSQECNKGKLKYADFTPSALLTRARR